MAKYVLTGIHTRVEKGQTKIFIPGEEIVPTEFELLSFPKKFMLVEEVEEVKTKAENNPEEDEIIEDEVEEVEEEVDEVIPEVDFSVLKELKNKLQELVDSGEYEDSVVDEAKAYIKKNPEKQHTVDALVANINKFFDELEDAEEVE